MAGDRESRINKLPFDLRTLDEKQLRDFIEVVVMAVQENFDVISGNAFGQAKEFNALGRDVDAIADYMGAQRKADGEIVHITGGQITGSHDELEDVSADDHHAQSHNQTDHDAAEAGDLSSIDIGDSASAGSSSEVPNADHQHAYPAPGAGYPVDVAATEADGSATTPARSDHRHAHGTGYAGGHSDAVLDGDTAGGDLSGTYPNPSVTDDSHAHTGSTIDETTVDHNTLANLATGDVHTQYRLEADNHTHQSSGAQAGTLDHGLALTGLTDDDHTIYLKEKASGGADTEVPSHAHGSTTGGDIAAETVDAQFLTADNFFFAAPLSPSQITSDQDDYNPTGWGTTSTYLRLSTDASRNITGLAALALYPIAVIHNVGSFNIVLKHETTSTAANRFTLVDDTDLTLKPDAMAILLYDNTTDRWRVLADTSGAGGTAGVDIQSVVGTSTNTSGTWTKPSGATWVEVICIGGGGGGGSGKKRATLNARGGGGGGGGGAYANARFFASELNADEDMQGGRYGSGGAAVSTNNTNGNNGTNGGTSFFGDSGTSIIDSRMVLANGGNFGAQGTNAGGAGGNAGSATSDVMGDEVVVGTAGGNGSAGAAAGTAGTSFSSAGRGGATGGGGGGGISGADANSNGGQGGERNQHGAGAGGSGSDGAVGGFGKSFKAVSPDDVGAHPGTGGGGGRGRVTGAAGNGAGGDGGYYGGGGGGGGAGTDSVADSGAGGNGGPGICLVVTFCD